ncbi:carboxymuconolactone decarboxylase family protein [Variovorax sp. J22R133]|uniref:carboxymuconolactone decarboxylase family protein n=1 Tax=Variovorax brevis TaxID=3053503 RepID=UPI002577A9F0|nr:carboxymuconolactone decarboxylase family protein [Variovorax sp. J22R133]MDM0117741.1 carboxymuconolactone decarboxylase family protein [Variovorax sp. J22R133]
MEFIHTIAPEDAGDAVAAMYRRQQTAWGFVPNYAKVFCHRPEVMARWGQLLAEIRRPMDARRFELVTFAAAHALRNSACTVAHGSRLRDFLADEVIVTLAGGGEVDALTPLEHAAMRFARQVARDASGVTLSEVEELKACGLSDAEVFDIAAVAAGRAFFAKLLDALGVTPDAPFLALDEALRERLVVGRGIDRRPAAQMPEAPAADSSGFAMGGSTPSAHSGRAAS